MLTSQRPMLAGNEGKLTQSNRLFASRYMYLQVSNPFIILNNLLIYFFISFALSPRRHLNDLIRKRPLNSLFKKLIKRKRALKYHLYIDIFSTAFLN